MNKYFDMQTAYTLLGLTLGIALNTQAQNVGINTDGSMPDSDAILHIKNDASSSKDSSVVRIENEQNGANDVTGVEIYNSGTGATAKWDVLIPASGSTDLRISNNGTDRVTIQNDGDVGIGTTSPASGLDIKTSMGYKINTYDASNPVPSSLDNTHNVILCNDGPYTVNLPAANTCPGRVYYIKNIDVDGDDITIDGNASETINESTTYALESYNHVVQIISDGTNWHIIEEANKAGGSITDALTCGSSTHNGTLQVAVAASGVSSDIPYTGGNCGTHSGQTVTSTGATGLTATLSSGSFNCGSGNLTYNITGTPASSGTASFVINIGGKACTLERTVNTAWGNATCSGATISTTPCSAVSGTSINDDTGTTEGTEYDWTGATSSGMANTSTTRALVDIGGQCWMRYNMNVTPSNFNPVPTWVNDTDVGWSGIYTGGPFPNEGKLYQWSAAMNGSTTDRAQGICPTGWHIPSDCEWMYLENSLGMSVVDQEMGGGLWRYSGDVGSDLSLLNGTGGTNNSGFSGLLAGYKNNGGYGGKGSLGYIWSSSSTGTTASGRNIRESNFGVRRKNFMKFDSFSVRCLKD